NIQDRYFDWDPVYNYRDRDVWVAGPITLAMQENFDAFWNSELSYAAASLDDVAIQLQHAELQSDRLTMPSRLYSQRMQNLLQMSHDGGKVWAHLLPYMSHVETLNFYADLPEKHKDASDKRATASSAVYQIISTAQHAVIMQTPYLVMSRTARQVFRELQRREVPVRVWVSSNSLAATDALPVYALSHKYKRLYLRELGFRIYEFKPFPATAYMNVGQSLGWHSEQQATANAPNVYAFKGSSTQAPIPLTEQGIRAGLHAKSMVIDEQIALIGSHNFDPRSDDYNTESFLVINDPLFSGQLSASIRNDMRPDNAWIVAPRESMPALADFNYSMGKMSEKLPIFDIWPWPYATSYQLSSECAAISYDDPKFSECAKPVGDFPLVNMSLKGIYTRIITVFGAGLEPIL
ncbi:MAG: phospholipase D-like domain-containing protein, partial [Shewanella sp.]